MSPQPNDNDQPLSFTMGETYPFEFDCIRYYPGSGIWFILKDPQTGLNTIPGFEAERWFLRVRPLSFQKDWDEDDAKAWGGFFCEVTGFGTDPATNEPTIFPLLSQSKPKVLEKLYPKGEFGISRQFSVLHVPGDESDSGTPITRFILEDAESGFTLATDARPFGMVIPRRGDILTLHVSADGTQNYPQIQTEQDFLEREETRRLLAQAQSVFSIGTEYDAEVLPPTGFEAGFVAVRVSALPELSCRIPVRQDIPVFPGDRIRLRCIGFKSSGYPRWAYASSPAGIPVDSLPLFGLSTRQESEQMEFKSSLVYPIHGNGEPDVDKQLGWEIARIAASFLNRDGGVIYVGVSDDGTVCGIELELNELNANSDSNEIYPPNSDGVKRKIYDILLSKLGKGVGSLLDVELLRSEDKHLVCKINVQPNRAPIPVFYEDRLLFVRCSASTRQLAGRDLAQFVLDRALKLREAEPAASVPMSPNLTPIESEDSCDAEQDGNAVRRYINLFTTGEASRTTNPPLRPLPPPDADCFCRIPIPDGMFNAQSRLLFCYDTGCVNVMNPKDISERLGVRGRKYANGFYREGKLLATPVCNRDDVLVILSRRNDGVEFIKAVPIAEYTVHVTMGTKGNECCGVLNMPSGSRALEYRILPAAHVPEHPWLRPRRNNDPGIVAATVAAEWHDLQQQFPPLSVLR